MSDTSVAETPLEQMKSFNGVAPCSICKSDLKRRYKFILKDRQSIICVTCASGISKQFLNYLRGDE